MSLTSQGKRPGRPRCGDVRIEFVVTKAAWDELLRREAASGGKVYRTRIAATILEQQLIGGTNVTTTHLTA
jgi:hypothetical protein